MRPGPRYAQHPFSTLELDSRDSGWRSLLLQRFTLASSADGAELPAVAAQTVVLTLRGRYDISSLMRTGRGAAEQRPGDLGMRAPGNADVLRWSSDGGPAPTLVQVHLPDGQVQRLADELRRTGRRPRRMPDTLKSYDPTVAGVLRDLLVAARAGAPDLVAASAGQYLAAHLLTRHQGEELPSARSTAGRRIGAVKHLLHAAYAEDLPLDALAREAGMSPFHLIRVFREREGVTPHRYLQQVRLERARDLLRRSDRPIAEVARLCGFPDPAYFSRAFRREHGCSPSAFRAERRSGRAEKSNTTATGSSLLPYGPA